MVFVVLFHALPHVDVALIYFPDILSEFLTIAGLIFPDLEYKYISENIFIAVVVPYLTAPRFINWLVSLDALKLPSKL